MKFTRTFIFGLVLTALITSCYSPLSASLNSPVLVKKNHLKLSDETPAGRDFSGAVEQISKLLPVQTDFIGVANIQDFLKGMESGAGYLPKIVGLEKMRQELSAANMKHLGVDLHKAETLIIFGSMQKSFGGLAFLGNLGDLPTKTKDLGSFKLLGLHGNIFVSSADGLALIKQVGTHKQPNLATTESFKAHRNAFTRMAVDGAMVVLSMNLSRVARKMARGLPIPNLNVEHAVATVTSKGKVSVRVSGDPLSLAAIQGLIGTGIISIKNKLNAMRIQNEQNGIYGEIISGIYGHYYVNTLLDSIQFNNSRRWLAIESNLELPGVWLVGVGAAVAIPAFMKYIDGSKTIEAIDQLDKIYKSSARYYTSPRVSRKTGAKLPCQFPASQVMTPFVGNFNCCGGKHDTDKDDRCDVDTMQWSTDTWSALNFQMNDQHYFGYAYSSSGMGANAKFTAYAYADLDCDGTLSTFMRTGYGDKSSNKDECSMKGGGKFQRFKESE